MIDKEMLDSFYGVFVYDSSGDKIGKIGILNLDVLTEQPTCAAVSTVLFVTSESFVSLHDVHPDGGDIHVSFTLSQTKDAPRVELRRELAPEIDDRLYEHYHLVGGRKPAVV